MPWTAAGPLRLFAYCHEGVGLGHLRRTLTICEQLKREFPGLRAMVATGSPYFPFLQNDSGTERLGLPPLRKRNDGTYVPVDTFAQRRQPQPFGVAVLLPPVLIV